MSYIIKCILIGQAGVGKTSLARKYFENKDIQIEPESTIGVDFHTKAMTIDNVKYKMHIWDTAGQERFHSIIKSYFTAANCAIFCFSLIDYETFVALNDLIDEFENHVGKPTNKILVGTFYDKNQLRKVNDWEIKALMQTKNLSYYFDVSSLTGFGLHDLFRTTIITTVELHKKNIIQLKKYGVNELHIISTPKKEKQIKNCC